MCRLFIPPFYVKQGPARITVSLVTIIRAGQATNRRYFLVKLREIFLISKASKPNVGLIPSPVELLSGIKRPGCQAVDLPPSTLQCDQEQIYLQHRCKNLLSVK
jgi:hypothetical protein